MQAPEQPSAQAGRKPLFRSKNLHRNGFFGRDLVPALLIVALVSNLAWSGYARGLPVQESILNFGKVSEHLYRGAQPDPEGMKSLSRLGVKLIVNLRMPGDAWKEEAAQATANGILYTNFPMSGTGTPSDDQVRQILGLFENFSDPIFVHCRHGCDRTGTIVACYRIQHDHWTTTLALREAKRYGISRMEFLMKRYVTLFARSVKPDQHPDLRQAKAN